jgi:hypothetical protein
MKQMLETVYSTKLYSKRCEYIQRKHLFQLKTKTYRLWVENSEDKTRRRKELICKGINLIEKL